MKSTVRIVHVRRHTAVECNLVQNSPDYNLHSYYYHYHYYYYYTNRSKLESEPLSSYNYHGSDVVNWS